VTITDPFEHDDAAYVLDALSEPERETVEAHLATCTARRPRGAVNAGSSADSAAWPPRLIPLAVTVWPTSHPAHQPAPRALSALTASPVHATAALKWGTQIDLDCRYAGYGDASTRFTYALQVIDRAGTTHDLGTWTLQRGADTTFTSRTAPRRDQIGSIQITRPNSTTILQLTT
jgi:Putative zinc-finger